MPNKYGIQNDTLWSNNLSFNQGSTRIVSDGQLVIGDTTGNPKINTLIAGSGIGIVNGHGTIRINALGQRLLWQNISADQTLAVQTGYFCISPGGALNLALPAVSALGDTIRIVLMGATSFTVTQAANQQIILGITQTTVGIGGSMASTSQGDCIEIICQQPNLVWVVTSPIGNLTIV